MKELISLPEANHIMLALLIVAPVVGVLLGLATKQLIRGAVYGVVLGGGNYVLWTVYNAITDQLGLDTVKNLIVNLTLFIIVGVVAGLVIRRVDRRPEESGSPASGETQK
jgi:hypothetical protein